jgi:maleamate amidohydrolase
MQYTSRVALGYGWRVARSGFSGRLGVGDRPALLIVDMSVGFTDARSPLYCDLDEVVPRIADLLEDARRASAPVYFTTVAYTEADLQTARVFIEKVPALRVLAADTPWVSIDPRLAPKPDEPVLKKLWASAFFGTDLSSRLTTDGVDTLVVVGASTSGCVRATVVDALQHGLRPLVPRSAVGDRSPTSSAAALSDIDGRYGDVIELNTARSVFSDHRTQ